MYARRGFEVLQGCTERTTVLMLCVALCAMSAAHGESRRVYSVDLPAQSLATALNALSEQTGIPVVFPYDLAKGKSSHPVTGRHTALDALTRLLAGTGLSGGLSEKGVLTISSAAVADQPGES